MKKKEVVILGKSLHLPQIIQLIDKAGFFVRGIIDSEQISNGFNEKKDNKELDAHEAIYNIPSVSISTLPEHIPIVCAFLDESEKDLFFLCMDFCKKNEMNFLHPVFALRDIEFSDPVSPKIKITGFPGSGNMLLQSFINHFYPALEQTSEEIFYSFVASHYYSVVFKSIQKICLLPIEAGSSDISAVFSPMNLCYGRINVSDMKNAPYIYHGDTVSSQVLSLSGFPLFSFCWDRIVGDHALVNRASVEFYKKKKFKYIVILRHPLDVIYSCLCKLPFREWDKNYNITSLFIRVYTLYLKELQKNKEQVYIVNYEKVLSDPLNTLKPLCEYIGITIQDKHLAMWCEENFFNRLAGTTLGHLKSKTLEQKWKKYFSKEVFSIVKKEGLLEIASSFGYFITENEFSITSPDYNNKDKHCTLNQLKTSFVTTFLSFWSVDKSIYTVHESTKGAEVYSYSEAASLMCEGELSKNSDFMYLVDSTFYGKEDVLNYKDLLFSDNQGACPMSLYAWPFR